MIHKKIENLIPYISENFITYPLWEEGKYIPFANFWIKVSCIKEIDEFDFKCKYIFKNKSYEIIFDEWCSSQDILHFQVHPKFKELKNGSYKFEKKDWSIEEMLDLLNLVIN